MAKTEILTIAVVFIICLMLWILNARVNAKQRVKRSSPKSTGKSGNADLPKVMVIQIPLASRDEVYKIESFTEQGKNYTVNLRTMECECSDFTQRRIFLAPTDTGRPCKHLRRALAESPRIKGTILEPYFADKYPCPNAFYDRSSDALLTLFAGKEWVNIYTFNNGTTPDNRRYRRYGFSLVEERWAYDDPPKKHEAIEDYIRSITPVGRNFIVGSGPVEFAAAKVTLPKILSWSVSESLRELYELANTILADGVIEDSEIADIVQWVQQNKTKLTDPAFRELFDILSGVTPGTKLGKRKRDKLATYLQEISKMIFLKHDASHDIN